MTSSQHSTIVPGHSAIIQLFRELPVRHAADVMGVRLSHIAGFLLLSTSVALLDGFMLAMLIPISSGLFEGSFAFTSDWPLFRIIFEQWPATAENFSRMFMLMATLTFLLGLSRGVFQYLLALLTEKLFGRYSVELAGHIFSRYLKFGKAYFDRHHAGELSTVMNYHHEFLSLFRSLLRALTDVLTLVTYMIVMLLISWRLLIVVALIFPVAFGMKRWVAKRIRKLSDDAQKDSMGIYGQLYQVLTAIPLFQAFSAEQIASQRYRNVAERLRSLQFRSSIYKGLVTPVQEVSSLLILLIILGMVLVLEGDGAKQIASMFVFFFVARLALPRLGSFNDIELEFEERLPSVREMFRIFDDEDKHIVPSGKSPITELRDAIEFRNLSFAYPGGPAVLHNVSFLVASGCMTALVGPSGSGKTTLTSLLMRYYDVSPGQLLIDGRDIREFSIASLRTHIAMVNQDVVLFSDTLRNNLTFGIEEAVSDTRLEQVLHNACLQELLESLPEGLDTVLGDRGLTLSGGQRQLVAIARALLRNAPILILDEATSSLDSRTERAVQKAIENVTTGCTSLVIAHRLSTIKRADRVVVLEGGQVVEKGTANELTSRRGLFHELLEAQKFD